MATEFSREFFSENRIVKADLRAAHQLREEDIARIKAEVKKLYDATEVILNVSVDESLLSGYVLQVGDRVFDNSGRHQLDQMMAGKPSLATLKTRIEDYKPAQTSAEGGTVISAADGVVDVKGMDKAVYGEIVTFENGAKGMVESVDPGKLGIMLFDGAETVGVGTLVTRSGKRAGIPVGDGFLGRVIDPLGEPIDGKGPVNAEGYNPICKQVFIFVRIVETCHQRKQCPVALAATDTVHLLAIVHFMDIIKHEDILLSIQVIIVVPLGGRTCHHPYTMFLGESMVEYKIIIPQVGK